MVRPLLKRLLGLLGRSEHKIIAVYAASGSAYQEAVRHVRAGAPEAPVWLLAASPVDAEVARQCERVVQLPAGASLPFRALRILWPHWVALQVVTFTREPGFGWLKLAPFFVPPWKLLIMNEHGDFVAGFPTGLLRHGTKRALDWAATALESVKDLGLGVVWKLAWTLLDPLLRLTAAPWGRLPEAPAGKEAAQGERQPGILVWIWGRHGRDSGEGQLRAWIEPLGLPWEISRQDRPTTNYKYILALCEARPPEGDPRGLLALFDRADTFAAGFQSGRAGFQKDLLPRAAFRRLEAGEAACVAAPLADAILLDAAKLARLDGIPAARSRQCRWLLLFWRAARAGWRSYSVGTGQTRLPMIPDRAFAEAEFCYRLLRQPRPRPGGRSLDSRRGSICFQPGLRRRMRSGLRRILIASPYLPFPLSHGGAVRIFNLARCLSARWELVLVSFREPEDALDYRRLSSVFARVVVVDQDERRRRDPAQPPAVVQFRTRAMAAAIREAAARYRPALLQIEYTQMAAYREVLAVTPAVLVEHDVTFSLYEQLYRTAPPGRRAKQARAEYERWLRYESRWLPQFDAVAVMSEPEKAQAVEAGAAADRAWIVPNGVDTERFQPGPWQDSPEMLYVGSFRHLPNVLGFQFLERELLPRLWPRFPDLRLRVVAGPEHEKHWRRLTGRGWSASRRDPRILVQGFVEDLAPWYARSWVVMVPLTVSAGTNIKVMEALACGRPVVSTPVGCAGLDLAPEQDLLVAGDAAGLAEAVSRVLEQPDLRRRLGERARQVAVERFSWENCARRAEEMYQAVRDRAG